MERINKVIASSGIASRRKADLLIQEGKVKVNGTVVKELGKMINENDNVEVNGVVLSKEEHIYILMNKPTGYITSVSDELGRRTVMNLLGQNERKYRLFPVGRLDYDTAGLLILTNDGDMAQMLMNPKHELEKEYLARVMGNVSDSEIRSLMKGVTLDTGYVTKKATASVVSRDTVNDSSLVDIVITEGKNHQVRKMMTSIGHEVKKLTRVRIGSLTIEGIKKGEYRSLKIHEIKNLFNDANIKKKDQDDLPKKITKGSKDYKGETRKGN